MNKELRRCEPCSGAALHTLCETQYANLVRLENSLPDLFHDEIVWGYAEAVSRERLQRLAEPFRIRAFARLGEAGCTLARAQFDENMELSRNTY